MFFYFSGSAPAYNASNADAVGFAVRPALHITGLNFFKKFFKDADPNKLQAYVAVPVGWVIKTSKWTDWKLNDNSGWFHIGMDLGTRYFFTKNVGGYAEIDMSTTSIGGGIGLCARF